MLRYDRRLRALALSLSALAGFVDAAGFLLTRGLFVSFMSGNSTRLAVAAAGGGEVAFVAGGLILAFLAGVVAGALIATASRARKFAVLAASTAALVVAAALATLGAPLAAAAFLAAAMGALNNVFLREGEVAIGVTYMTGTLVRAGQRIARAIAGQGESEWRPYLLLWAALVCGAVAGAAIAARSAALSLWIAAGLAALLSAVARGQREAVG